MSSQQTPTSTTGSAAPEHPNEYESTTAYTAPVETTAEELVGGDKKEDKKDDEKKEGEVEVEGEVEKNEKHVSTIDRLNARRTLKASDCRYLSVHHSTTPAAMTAASSIFWHVASPGQPIVSLALPPKLFYVRHGCSQPYPTVDGGFISQAPNRDIRDPRELKENAIKHFEWRNRNWNSCFVSVFGDQDHAESWGRKLATQHGQPTMLYELDTSQLPPGTMVLNAWLLCDSLGIDHLWNDDNDEYLFYKGIPGSCVVRSWDPWWGYDPQIGVASPRSRGILSSWADAVTVAEQAQVIHKAQWAINHGIMGADHQGRHMPFPNSHQTAIPTTSADYYGMETHQEHCVPLPIPGQPTITASLVHELSHGMETHQGHTHPMPLPFPLPHQAPTSARGTTLVVQAIQGRTDQIGEWLQRHNAGAAGQIINTVSYPNIDDLGGQMKGLNIETAFDVQPSPAMTDAVAKTRTSSAPTTGSSTSPSITITESSTPDPSAGVGAVDPKLPVLSAAQPAKKKPKKKAKKEKKQAKKEKKARNAPCWTKGQMLLS
ncbi:hypothetical protein B0T20DRAFT_466463 [Sordaria brevicollis]|uniref:DUF7587 domain-containing protein n=1 Tax=Sordaria brevicollis TaxID=83679 RepID=A0AAE0UEP8_SORBR|nr:hypothetical protein B0T20DRAFT_466463 [Sordaria brevicollis]